jgi:hypothetical protein
MYSHRGTWLQLDWMYMMTSVHSGLCLMSVWCARTEKGGCWICCACNVMLYCNAQACGVRRAACHVLATAGDGLSCVQQRGLLAPALGPIRVLVNATSVCCTCILFVCRVCLSCMLSSSGRFYVRYHWRCRALSSSVCACAKIRPCGTVPYAWCCNI